MRRRDVLALVADDLVRRGRAQSTVAITLRALDALLAHAAKPVASIDADDVRAFLAARSEAIGARTQVSELSRLRAAFEILVRHGVLASSPTERLRVLLPPPAPQLLLSETDVAALLRAALEEPTGRRAHPLSPVLALRDRAAVELLYSVGLRVSEACDLRVLDLDLVTATVVARRLKGSENRVLPLPRASVPPLANYLRDGRPRLAKGDGGDGGRLLLSKDGAPTTRNLLLQVVRAAAKRSGFRAYPRALRRAVATHAVRAKVPLSAVQALLGHRSLETTALYLSYDRDDLRRAVAILDREPE